MNPTEQDYAKIFEASGMGKDMALTAKVNAYISDMLELHRAWELEIPEELATGSDGKKLRLHAPEIFKKPT